MLLRNATTADLPELVDVQEAGARIALAHVFPQDVHPFPRAAIRGRWASELADPEVEVYVAVRREPTIEGFAAVRVNELLHFGTAVDTWGTGFATTIHSELVQRLARSGRPTAWLRVFEQNHRARRFYEKMGWTPTQRLTRSTYAPYPTLIDYETSLPGAATTGPGQR
ncbi:GNAT family N-acetyltransferase [Actinoplanes sp. LDG1-06]|uniref:GNAT family N-acetyltransferase n=1 Tax=Paractinoplanes ovalisporus TaxID=2810368 RepID=A0ABS2A5D5_9ACTN|nr:GNAT family N-acetyltransferase [Actinoplanes ovalisporus]MBM2615052.1 GNAT family N-acetyltransferase [Actinoplanes ovalisporus]